MTDNPTIANFVATYGPQAQQVAQAQGLTTAEVLGQWGEESGWGTSSGAKVNNLGNVSPGGSVASYSSIADGTSAYAGVLKKMGIQGISDPSTFANALQANGYATDPQYASKVTDAINTVTPYVAANDTSSSSGTWANLAGVVGAVAAIPLGPSTSANAGAAANKAVATGSISPITDFITKEAGSYGLVIFGGILALGALLISQRKNVTAVVGKVGEVAALAG